MNEFEFDFELTENNLKFLNESLKDYTPHHYKLSFADGTLLDLVEKTAYDSLKNENEQLKELIQELKADYGNKAQVERDLLKIELKKYLKENK